MFLEVCIIALLALATWYINLFLSRKNSKEPPGPVPLPFLGNLITIARASAVPHEALGILAEKYGEIFKLQMGTVSTVVLASAKAAKAILTKEDASGRDCRGMLHDRSLKQNLGIAFSNGEVFKTTRTWTFRVLKELGFNRNNLMECRIQEEANHFIQKMKAELKKNDDIFDVNMKFTIHTLNITWMMLKGERANEDNRKFTDLLKASDEFMRVGVLGTGLLVAYPFLRYVFPDMTGFNTQMKCIRTIHGLAMDLLHEHKAAGHYKIQPQNYIEAYLEKMDEEAGKADTVFTEDNFKVILDDLFQASSESTSSLLETLLLYLSLNPEIQKKVLDEIENTIAEGASIGMDHYKKMTYTQAVIYESHRHAKILPQGVPHLALNDIYYNEYIIKKGTIMLPATEAMNNDPKFFTHPNEFNPEHFIDKKGNLINTDKIFPFGFGKRACPGESVAQLVAFIFIVTLLKEYEFFPEPNVPLPSTIKMQNGITRRPYPYKVLVKPRY